MQQNTHTAADAIIGEGFELLEVIDHKDIKHFIRREIMDNQGWGLLGKMYQGMGLLLFGFILIKAFAPVWRSGN